MKSKEPIDIAVIGIGMDFPACSNVNEYCDILFNSINCTSHLSLDRKNKVYNYAKKYSMGLEQLKYMDGSYVNNLDEFDYEFFKILPKEASLMDPVQRKYMQVIIGTIEDAGYSMEALQGKKIGDYVGYTSCSFKDNYIVNIFDENPDLVPYSILGNTAAMIPSRIAQLYDFRGPVMVIDTACSSSLVAIYEACKSIMDHTSEMALAGGIKINFLPLDSPMYKLGIESSDAKTRVFDILADGSGIGEGIAAVLLKPLEQAQKDKDRIYAVIKGASINHDGTSLGLTAPNPVSQADVINMAWKQANLDIEKLKYIEMHGTATKLGDPIEFQGLSKAFAMYTNRKQFCAVGSVKSNFGHMFEAAGIASFIKAVIILNRMVIPPSLNLNYPNDEIQLIDSPMYINTKNTIIEGSPNNTLVGVSAFGLSGTNCHIVLQGYENEIEEPIALEDDNSMELVCLSANSEYSLLEYMKEYLVCLEKFKKSVSLKRLCYNINTGRNLYRYRITMYIKSYQDFEEKLEKALAWLNSKDKLERDKVIQITDQCFFGCFSPNKIKWKRSEWGKLTTDEIMANIVKGRNIKWNEYYLTSYPKLSLPLYHFKPNKLWFEKKKNLNEENKHFYLKQWVRDFEKHETETYKKALVIGKVHSSKFQDLFHNQSCEVFTVAHAGQAAEMIANDLDIELIIYSFIENDTNNIYYSLDELASLIKQIDNERKLNIIVITYNTYSVSGEGITKVPIGAMLHGFGKCISKEKNNILFKGIDLEDQATVEDYKELFVKCCNETVVYRSGNRYIEKLTEYEHGDRELYKLSADGVYVITGGLGGMGTEIAKYLGQNGPQRKIILLGRRKLTDRNENSEILSRWIEVKRACSKVEYISCDISDEAQVEEVFDKIYNKYSVIHGIFHTAGVPGGKTIDELSLNGMHEAIKSKVTGTILLDRVTSDRGMDFMVLFSSIATVFSSYGLAHYCAANAFLDSYSSYYNSNHQTHCMTVNWTTWSETGMSVKSEFTIDTLFKCINNKEALEYFMCVLGKRLSNVIIGELNLKSMISLTLKRYPYRYSEYIENAIVELQKSLESTKKNEDFIPENKKKTHNTVSSGSNLKYSDIEQSIIAICQELMGYEEIEINRNFFELGADSVLLSHMFNKLDMKYPNLLKITDIFTNPSIAQLSRYLEQQSEFEEVEEYRVRDEVDDDSNDIAIIGVGINFPSASNTEEYWQMLNNGIDVIRRIPTGRRIKEQGDIKFKCNTYKQIGYLDEIDKFDYRLFGISPNDAELMDPVSRLFLQCCWSALEDAGYGGDSLKASDTGVAMGYSANLANLYSRLLYEYDVEKFASSLAINQISMMPSRISYIKDFHGPSMVIDTACSSSLVAIHTACEWIKSNKCKVVLAGGASLALASYDNGMGVGYEASDCRTRVFSNQSNGAGIGEGIGVVVIKRYSEAVRDKDAVYAVIKGSAVNQDGSSFGIAAPNLKAQADVISKAWDNAGVNPEEITYIETHGTGTYLGDTIEFAGIQDAFERYTNKKQFCAIGSVKSNLGHLNEASGMASLIKVLLMIKNRWIAPTLHISQPNENIDWITSSLYLADSGRQWEGRNGKLLAGISAFGMSGTNSHMVLEAVSSVKQADCNKEQYYIVLSGKSRDALYRNIWNLYSYLMCQTTDTIDAISYTLCCGRTHLEYRLAFLVSDRSQLESKLVYLLDHFEEQGWENIYYGYYHIVPETKVNLSYGDIYLKDKEKLDKENMELLQGDRKNISHRLLSNFVCGAFVDFKNLLSEQRCVAHLPAYAFERSRVWFGEDERKFDEEAQAIYYHSKRWKIESNHKANIESGRTIVIIHWAENDVKDIVAGLGDRNIIREWVIAAPEGKLPNDCIALKGTEREDFKNALIAENFKRLDQIIYIPRVGEDSCFDFRQEVSSTEIQSTVEVDGYNNCFFIPLHIVKAVADMHSNWRTELLFLVKEMNYVTEAERYLRPNFALIAGLAKVIEQEFANIRTMVLDTDDNTDCEDIVKEILNAKRDHYILALRNGERYCEILDEVNLEEDHPYVFDKEKVYLITGGTSGMGLELALTLAELGCTKLAIISRQNPLNLNKMIQQGEMLERINKLERLVAIAPDIGIYECDVSNGEILSQVLNQIRKRFGKIHGVFHCAGITKAGFIMRKDEKDYREILDVKTKGTVLLDNFTRQDRLDFMILFSSAITLVGEAGQCDYVAANFFLDSYMEYRNHCGYKTFCVNWVSWSETGMSVRNHINVDGMTKVIKTKDALSRLFDMMNSKVLKAIIGEFNYGSDMIYELVMGRCEFSDVIRRKAGLKHDKLKKLKEQQRNLVILPHSMKPEKTTIDYNRLILKGKNENEISVTEKNIASIYCRILGHTEIDLFDNFFEMGGDSIMIMKMQLEIEKLYPGCIVSSDLFEFTTVESLAAYIDRKSGETAKISERKEVAEEYSFEEKDITGSEEKERNIISPLSYAQRRIYVEQMRYKGTRIYNNPLAIVLYKQFTDDIIKNAIDKLIERHQALRTSFEIIDGSVKQIVHSKAEGEVEKIMVDDCDLVDLRDYLYDFELSSAPLIHGVLLEDQNKQILMLDLHHIILDGLSSSILVRELVYILKGKRMDDVDIDYLDFVQGERDYINSDIYKTDQEYWKQVLEEIRNCTVYEGDINDGDMKEYYSIYEQMNKDIESGLQEVSKKYHISLFSILLGAVYLTVQRLTAIDWMTIAIPSLGRDKPEYMGIVGNFVNLLPIPMKVNSQDKIIFYKEVFVAVQNAMKHQMYPYNRIANNAKKKYGIDKLYSIMFEYENKSMGLLEDEDDIPKGESRVIRQTGERSQLDIKINYHNEMLVIGINYNRKTFSKEFIIRFYENYLKVLGETIEEGI